MVKIDVEVKTIKSEIETSCGNPNEGLWYGPGQSKVQITKSQAEQVQQHAHDQHAAHAKKLKTESIRKGAREVCRLLHPSCGSPELICSILLIIALAICLAIWA